MRKVYLAISYSNRKFFNNEINVLIELFEKNNIKLFVFVDEYNFNENEEEEMMETAFREIDESDFLIAELTTKSIGVGIEIGYAYAKEKPIIYIRKKDSEYSTTASGSSSYNIEYKNITDLKDSIQRLIKQLD